MNVSMSTGVTNVFPVIFSLSRVKTAAGGLDSLVLLVIPSHSYMNALIESTPEVCRVSKSHQTQRCMCLGPQQYTC